MALSTSHIAYLDISGEKRFSTVEVKFGFLLSISSVL